MNDTPWTQTTYRRFSVDIHVPDWHPDLLSRFDAAEYIGHIARGGMRSMLHYTNSHVGLCLWPTNVGQRHANLGDRDFFGEVVAECRRQGIHPLAYFSLFYDNWAYETHPDWRITPADGWGKHLQRRYGLVCLNSGYRDYVLACVNEITTTYDIDGMFCDMTFWPGVCYCPHCTARFWREEGAELPRIVDWNDPVWLAFQSARKRWLVEFAQLVTDTAKANRPGLTFNHQFSTIFHNWTLGVPLELAGACDYVGGDFYGGAIQHSLACKVYHGLSKNLPFEFHTSRTRHPTDHVSAKPLAEVRVEAGVAVLHGAALMLVDYINADGTLNPQTYTLLGQLNAEVAQYEPFLGGQLRADVAIYMDNYSFYNPDENGVPITELKAVDRCPHRESVVGLARMLQSAHIPFGVVTNANLDQLDRFRAVCIPNVLALNEEQAAIFRDFVAHGGVLYASGASAIDRNAEGGPRNLLEDVLGVRYTSHLGTKIVYLTPDDAAIANILWPQDHLSHAGSIPGAEAASDADVLAWTTLPFVLPEGGTVIGSRFAAIHSNPPALDHTASPAIVQHTFGEGRTIWVGAPIEASTEQANKHLFVDLLKRVLPGPYAWEADTAPTIEVTVFHQQDRQRLNIGLLNLQAEIPQTPVGANLRVQLPDGARAQRLVRLPAQEEVAYEVVDGQVHFQVEPFDTLALFACELA